MLGSATFTTVMSRMTMNWARHSSTSAHQRRESEAGRCGAPAWTGGMLPVGRAEWSLIGSSLLLLMRADRVALVLGVVLPWLGSGRSFLPDARGERWPGRHPMVGMGGGTRGGILLRWRLRLGGPRDAGAARPTPA